MQLVHPTVSSLVLMMIMMMLMMMKMMVLVRMTPQWRLAALCVAYLLYLFLGATLFSAIGIIIIIIIIIVIP